MRKSCQISGKKTRFIIKKKKIESWNIPFKFIGKINKLVCAYSQQIIKKIKIVYVLIFFLNTEKCFVKKNNCNPICL